MTILLPVLLLRRLAAIGYFSIFVLIFTFIAIGIIIYMCAVIYSKSPQEVEDDYHVHITEEDRQYNMFDGMMRADRKWIMHLGDHAYNFLLWANTKLNAIRRRLGMPYWSLSQALKKRTKRALNHIHNFEGHVADYCRRKEFDGAICGHIHVAEMREIDGITYMNDGDWVESCTALVEHHDGRWELLHFQPHAVKDDVPSVNEARIAVVA